jgi:hypothetical protein
LSDALPRGERAPGGDQGILFLLAKGPLAAVRDAERADDARSVEDRHDNRAFHAGCFRTRAHVPAGVGLYVACVDGLRALDSKTSHALANRNFLNDRKHRRRKVPARRPQVQQTVAFKEMERAGVRPEAAYDAGKRL